MTMLVVATVAFLATHFLTSTPLRPVLVNALGEWPYRGVYSTIALVTLVWMAWAYAGAPREQLWTGFRVIAVVVMPLAFLLIACGYSRNPTMVGADKLLKSANPARGIIRVTRHPIMWGVMLWAAVHILASGDLKSVIFFGGFLLLAVVGTLSMDARKRANPDWARFAAVTSHVPFVAIAQGRNHFDWREIGWVRPAIGLAVFALFFLAHSWLFGGARPY
jgi:uncharacterized membrane protein